MTIQAQLVQLEKRLLEEIACAEDLYRALTGEAEALGQHSAERLEAAVSDKVEKLQRMENAGTERHRQLDRLNRHVTDPGKRLQPPFSAVPRLHRHWQALMDIAGRCQQLNQVNGQLVALSQRQSRHALEIIQGLGKTAENPSTLYNESGKTASTRHSHKLASV